MPVTPGCALLMFHPFDFERTLGDRQGHVLVVGEETVRIRNAAIAANAVRQVFNSNHDFEVANLALANLKS